MVFLAIVHLIRNKFHASVVKELWHAYAAVVLFVATYAAVEKTFFEPIYLIVVICTLVLAHYGKTLLLSFASIAALLFYIGDLSHRYFPNMISWPISLLLLGLGCFWMRARWLTIRKA